MVDEYESGSKNLGRGRSNQGDTQPGLESDTEYPSSLKSGMTCLWSQESESRARDKAGPQVKDKQVPQQEAENKVKTINADEGRSFTHRLETQNRQFR